MHALLDRPPMARSEDRPHASQLRWGEKSAADLRKAAEQQRALGAQLDALAAAVEEAGIRRLRIDGVTKLTRGSELLSMFVGSVHKALIDHRTRPKS